MKKIVFTLLLAGVSIAALGQNNTNNVNMELGKGLTVSTNSGAEVFNIGGYVQLEGIFDNTKDNPNETRFGVRRAYLSLGGSFFREKLSFYTQFDFADSYPLLDAWVAWHPIQTMTVSVGQKQAFSGPLSMGFSDKALALGNRSLADRTFYASGRELGIFIEGRIPMGPVGLDLGGAVTTGDGRNSFGSSSLDFDLGGLKYTGRATFFPLGFFSEGNDRTDVDFAREKKPKLAIGGTFSYNVGASDAIGEGHGTMSLFDSEGKADYPDYQKIAADLMFKYSGFTLLAEYVNATAAGLKGLYSQPQSNAQLVPRQIAEFLVLGSGYSVQAGYLFRRNWAVDVRYSAVAPEWKDKTELLNKMSTITGGIAKYFIDNRLKIQLAATYTDWPDLSVNNKRFTAEITAHVVF